MLLVFTAFIVAFIIILNAFNFLRISSAAWRSAGRTVIVGTGSILTELVQQALQVLSDQSTQQRHCTCITVQAVPTGKEDVLQLGCKEGRRGCRRRCSAHSRPQRAQRASGAAAPAAAAGSAGSACLCHHSALCLSSQQQQL